MCGILGSVPSIEPHKFLNSLNKLAHRGPDGYGTWHDQENRVSLGHRRLSILDLSENGKQPMHWGDRYVITFNGEIYNYLELRANLEQRGIKFKTGTDTEVLLAMFAEEGVRCFDKLNGMWAFAIYDKQEDTLVLSRDRMGEKPLFYLQDKNRFYFASEMKALYPFLNEVIPDIEVMDMAKSDMFSYEATEKCLIKGILRFPSASYGIYKNRNLKLYNFWKPLEHLISVPRRYEEQVEIFKEIFIDACKIRMRSDVPIGTALSGGIDSSATISAMSYVAKNLKDQFSNDWQHAFVASFPGSHLDETAEARKVAEYVGVDATYLNIDPLKEIDKLYYYSYMFEEFYLTSPIPFIQLYGKIKTMGTTVTLDGHGSDELFAGYPVDIKSKIKDDFPNPFKIKQTLQTISDGQNINTKMSYGRVYLETKNIVKQKLAGADKPLNIKTLDNLNNQLYKSSFQDILPTLLRNYDRYSMINGVEIRMPFLDHRIVSYAFSIPGSSKVRNGYSKSIVRDAMKGFFPEEIRLLKKKTGFNSPFTEWMKGPLKEWLLDLLESQQFKTATYIEPKSVKDLIYKLIENPKATPADGGEAWISLMPFIWEQSLSHANKH